VDDDEALRSANAQTLELAGFIPQTFDCAVDALTVLSMPWKNWAKNFPVSLLLICVCRM
jgi:hypothetical protein